MGPRDVRVDLGDDHARPVQHGGEIFVHQPEAMAALGVSRGDLHQRHVHRQRAGPDQPGQVRVMARHDVQQAGARQLAVRAAGGVAEEVDHIGLVRLQCV
ncbi:hypothetical protein D3C85_1135420 [compost metagenome]